MAHPPLRIWETELSIPFHDLDPMHIVWHGNYLKYFDIARIGLFRNAGVDMYEFYQKTGYLFPITKTTTKHIVPLRYGDHIVCRAEIIEARIKIVIDFEIRRVVTQELCTRGRGEQVAVKSPGMEMELEIPAAIRTAFGFSAPL